MPVDQHLGCVRGLHVIRDSNPSFLLVDPPLFLACGSGPCGGTLALPETLFLGLRAG